MRKTMTQKPIDIIQEFVDLYKHEQMLAFFEFHVGGAQSVCHEVVPGWPHRTFQEVAA
jgi:hypothetical protein